MRVVGGCSRTTSSGAAWRLSPLLISDANQFHALAMTDVVGISASRGNILRHISKMLFVTSRDSVPEADNAPHFANCLRPLREKLPRGRGPG